MDCDAQGDQPWSQTRCPGDQSEVGPLLPILSGSSLGIATVFCAIENNAADIEQIVESFARVPDGGLVVLPDSTTQIQRTTIITLAARYRFLGHGWPSLFALRHI
jgi:hypothetical protein